LGRLVCNKSNKRQRRKERKKERKKKKKELCSGFVLIIKGKK